MAFDKRSTVFGKAPKEAMDAALASLGTHYFDATDITVSGGTPRVLVRFLRRVVC